MIWAQGGEQLKLRRAKRASKLTLPFCSGIIARMFAKKGAHVTGLDFSDAMLEKGRERSQRETLKGKIEYGKIYLMNYDEMAAYMENKE